MGAIAKSGNATDAVIVEGGPEQGVLKTKQSTIVKVVPPVVDVVVAVTPVLLDWASGGDDIGVHAAVRGGDVARGLVGGGDVGDLDGDAALGPDTAPALAVSGGTGLGVTDGDTRERDVGAPAGGGGAAVAGLDGNALVVADTITAAAASGVTGLGISNAALGLGNGATGRISVAAVGGRAGVALTFGDDVDRDTTVVGGEVKRSVVAALPPL
ncbi:uncharacterized protein IUM83_06878 [Phytophthora cinnamomi]|uniref:uncharacterized protein n=1 Tax=Phytophthora cinnamomi TaxID=4785 RepID=UPI0035596109|nr:hypothetical protein IUM83_06878 [Phytophthora cinnamomi]